MSISGWPAAAVAAAGLGATLVFAVWRPRGRSEALVAVPIAALLVVLGVEPAPAAWRALLDIGPTVGFLAAVLALGRLCADAGVFAYLGSLAARSSRGDPRRLLALVVVLAAAVTVTLTLDATVVLLTPVVLATTTAVAVRPRPQLYACVRVANSGSLLLPVSNLTNLLAFGASGLSFVRFAALMSVPWVLACTLEWAGLRRFFAADLRGAGRPQTRTAAAPRYALGVLGVTVSLFVVASAIGIPVAWAAVAGCLALLIPGLRKRRDRRRFTVEVVHAASAGFCAFVLALSVTVDALRRHGLARALAHVVPGGTSFPALIALALVAGVLANLVNNLPATLALIPLVSLHPAAVLAVLIGVNIGPAATYPGSLATLLWRRMLPAQDKPRAGQFHLLGVLVTPVIVVAVTAALWLSITVIGI